MCSRPRATSTVAIGCGRSVANDLQVIVSWDGRLCAAATFGVVSERRDDLFYPGSDDALAIGVRCERLQPG